MHGRDRRRPGAAADVGKFLAAETAKREKLVHAAHPSIDEQTADFPR